MVNLESALIGTYSVAAGFGILGWWALEWASHGKGALLAYGASHMVAEMVTLGVLLFAGVSDLLGNPYSTVLVPIAMGMLLYATINAIGRIGRESPRLGGLMLIETGITSVVILIILFGL